VSLREEQIQRYGRQILLREVGGKGQARLLACPVRVDGGNAATDVAVAFLAAGGTPIEGGAPADGFVAGAEWAAFAPDAKAQGPAEASLASAGARPSLPVAVVVGGDGLAFAPAGACLGCLEASAARLSAQVDPRDAVLLGSLAALVLQRLVLSPGADAQVGLFLRRGAGLARAPAIPCATHSPSGGH
jgi:hypothetical protein